MMVKIKELRFISSLFGFIAVIIMLLGCMAALSVTAEASMGGFSVNPIFPESQRPDEFGFFDLWVAAGNQQEIGIAINNYNDEDIHVSITLLTSNTNRNGIIDYTVPGVSDISMRHAFADIASVPVDEVTIPARYSGQIPIFIDIPVEGFDGIILGSIRITNELTEEQIAASGLTINRYSHIIVVRLQERDRAIPIDFQLGDVGVTEVNFRDTIVADIRHPQPRLTIGATVNSQVYSSGSNTPLFERRNIRADFAPYSVFQYSMIDDGEINQASLLPEGRYIARIQVFHEGESWEFEREFQIGETMEFDSVQREAMDSAECDTIYNSVCDCETANNHVLLLVFLAILALLY